MVYTIHRSHDPETRVVSQQEQSVERTETLLALPKLYGKLVAVRQRRENANWSFSPSEPRRSPCAPGCGITPRKQQMCGEATPPTEFLTAPQPSAFPRLSNVKCQAFGLGYVSEASHSSRREGTCGHFTAPR